VDDGVPAGATVRYRLEAFFADGSSRKVAEGAISIGANAGLGRVYPNPYRPRNGQALQIPYRVPSADGGKSVGLRVFDSSGRLVRRIDGATPAGGGFGSLTWDGRDDRGRLLADGVYFVRLQGPGIDDARQFILLR
jgi:flagellar hook assembly protein FlgD